MGGVEALTASVVGVAAKDPKVGVVQENGERGDEVMIGLWIDLVGLAQ